MDLIPAPRQSVDDEIRSTVAAHGGEFADHIVGHFELVAELHNPNDPDGSPVRVRFSPRGSSLHMSLGLLRAAAAKVERQVAQ